MEKEIDNFIGLREACSKLYKESERNKTFNSGETISLCLRMQHDYKKYLQDVGFESNIRDVAEWTNNWIEKNII